MAHPLETASATVSKRQSQDEEVQSKGGFPAWAIGLIVGALVLLGVIIWAYSAYRDRNKVTAAKGSSTTTTGGTGSGGQGTTTTKNP